MGKIYQGIEDLVGHTPLVALNRYAKKLGLGANVIVKLESYNPAGSVKDRAALQMIIAKEEAGEIRSGGTIIEGTSGNTGIAIAAIGAARGYQVKICMPDDVSVERRKLIASYGGEVILTPGADKMGGAGATAAAILAQTENAVILGQGANPKNPEAHYRTTGPEIWEDTDGKIDIFVAATGTGGTISGTGKYLKEQNPEIRIVAVEPTGNAVLTGGEPGYHKIQGIGGGPTPPVTDVSLFDEVIDVTDEDAYETARLVPKVEGLSIGISAAAALYAATQVAKRPENAGKTIVVMIPDSGDHYLSGDLYE
ncbi:MAG: cysteine synthase A [Lachnospiraceae bacterium]|nr:cysteine synthase A [Lachnospiraceae bacterium]